MSARILIVEARFYAHISDALLDGATAALKKSGAEFERIDVPGALEIPSAIQLAVGERSGSSFDGFVALGCVIRGDTYHFEIVANESARGLMQLSLQHGLCIGNGILTCETEAQAIARSARDGQDKGGGAARACLALIAARLHLKAMR